MDGSDRAAANRIDDRARVVRLFMYMLTVKITPLRERCRAFQMASGVDGREFVSSLSGTCFHFSASHPSAEALG